MKRDATHVVAYAKALMKEGWSNRFAASVVREADERGSLTKRQVEALAKIANRSAMRMPMTSIQNAAETAASRDAPMVSIRPASGEGRDADVERELEEHAAYEELGL